MTARFALDKSHGKIMGVCSGLARWMNVDVTIVRIVAVALTLLGFGSTILVYLAIGLIANAD
ncbi:PspC domain-containing protein [Sphingobium boeckii]|uniref:Phage shock protein PspC (Stress-responsive transcriptional regulator) n=1 Tax=Sphingobium boeckii TaxID=1082345 RepID=A0A7W9AEU0_9SPHN|nr:PspC domain-containing protein [Sphingobium boeckii]MBB5684237.1 phage shock protein PspC (stress-responsive transcriptional regulator) [Sphingobium boeckii]